MDAQALESGQKVFDEKAKAAYQKRILGLQEAIEEADTAHDSQRLGALQEEHDRLLDYLSGQIGKAAKRAKLAKPLKSVVPP